MTNVTKALPKTAKPKKKSVSRIVFPLTSAVKVDKFGNRYLTARVTTIIEGESTERTLMARGAALDAIARVMIPGKAVKIAVNEDRIPNGGLFYTGLAVPNAPRIA